MENPTLVLLAVVGATWTAFNTSLATVKYLNELRDQVLIGKIGGNEISLLHRQTIYSDWFGTAIIYAMISVSYAVAIFLVPWLVKPEQRRVMSTICTIFAAVVLLGTTIPFCLALVTERPQMIRVLKEQEQELKVRQAPLPP
jgi:hypothetical protein